MTAPGSVGDVEAAVELEDGRLTMTAEMESELVVRATNSTPPSEGETRATFRLYSSEGAVRIELDAHNLDTLADEIDRVRDELDD